MNLTKKYKYKKKTITKKSINHNRTFQSNKTFQSKYNKPGGSGVIPTTIYKNNLLFLFGREGKYDTDNAKLFSDIGGGVDKGETYMDTAIRESVEEMTGFLGSYEDMRKLLKKTYQINYQSRGHKPYRTHIFKYPYDKYLPKYYNNNHIFLEKKLDKSLLKTSKIFEKDKLQWFSIEDLKKTKHLFKTWYRNIIDIILKNQNNIKKFIRQGNHCRTVKLRLHKP